MTTSAWSAWRATLAPPMPLILRHHSIERRQILLIRWHNAEQTAWTEASPLPGWSADTLAENIAALPSLSGQTPQQALSIALPAALSTAVGLLTLPHCSQRQARVPSNRLLLESDHNVGENTENIDENVVKLKVGREPIATDIERIRSLLQRYSQMRLRLDANQSWQYDDIHKLDAAFGAEPRIDYIEEPLLPELSYDAWPLFTRLRFAHDERLRLADFLPDRHCTALVVKPSLLGWHRIQALHQWAQENAKPIILSSSFESRIGLNQLNNLAHHWQLEQAQGLATADFFNNDWRDTVVPPLSNLIDLERLL